MLRRLVWLCFAVLLISGGVANADDAALGRRGETVYPISSQQVRMMAEEVRLKVRPLETLVDVTFTFTNAGAAQDVLMGFPVGRPGNYERGDFELHDFQTWVDGKRIPAQREKGSKPVETPAGEDHHNLDYPEWYTWTVKFDAGETHTVRNTYRAVNFHTSNGFASTGYILRTGKVWQDTIGSAVVRVSFDGVLPGEITGVSPASYRWVGEEMVWGFKDFEPNRDVQLVFQTRTEGWATGSEVLSQARQQYLGGDQGAALRTVREQLEAGSTHPIAVYLAAREGLRAPAELLKAGELPSVLKRYLQDKAGVTGVPPRVPVLAPDGMVTLGDPDGDLDDWGLTVYASADAGAAPIQTAGGLEAQWQDRPEWQFSVDAAPWHDRSEVWYQAWAVDGRGHMVESGLVKLALRAPEPQTPEPRAPAPQTPEPVGPVLGDVRQPDPLPWILLGLMLCVSVGYYALRRES